MKIYDSSSGSVLIFLILTITILSVLGAAILSITTTSLYSELSFNKFNKASYYAESGIRYTRLTDSSDWYFDDKTYFTMLENAVTAELAIVQDSNPDLPAKIDTAGFHIGITDCNIESTGIVNEDSSFEAARKIITPNLRGLPCWTFDILADNTLADSCGKNRGRIEGSGIILLEPGKKDWSWKFDGASYVKTLFRPYCEIGDGVSFSISFWVRPENNFKQVFFGVSGLDYNNNNSTLAAGISSDGKWEWFYGDQPKTESAAVTAGKWQHIIIIFDNNAAQKKVYFNIQDCIPSNEQTFVTDNTGTASLPYSNKHMFIGAENTGSDPDPNLYFQGEIDEFKITTYEEIPDIDALIDELSPLCAVAYYPFNGNANDVINGYDGIVMGGTALIEDRFGNPDQAYNFSGNNKDFIKVDHNIITQYPFTVNSWIKPKDNIDGWKTIFTFAKKDPGNPDLNVADILFGSSIRLSPLPQLIRFLIVNDPDPSVPGKYWDTSEIEYTYIPDTWHMITVVFADENNRKLYIDGQTAIESTSYMPYNPGIDLFIIGRAGLKNLVFNGAIDDVAVYDTILSAEEILALYEDSKL
ncbi:Concanavalin A-like lectin/glucanases domain-containing protein [Desulfonema limicola]|uniref:Concanavalin A-like lectin/glucanases domain-containing protein n=1 Tax=Desulfonema limicola TaxID=45656 RepID=A0A975GFM7_9BACT|nr:LamG domain-containing protein [Desulfonema limicola]QTA79334.1 Concanavalin A-like lectin/glucanases domain-containing protein [Desulfonema limicola]